MMTLTVTISGLHGTGKTTYARILSKDFGLRHISAGDLFRQIAKGKGVSILICEQNIRFAFSISGRGYILDKGRVHHQGPVDELREDEEVKSCLAV